jgi:ribokinase
MADREVVGLGAMNVDQLYRVERLVVDGEAVVEETSFSPGGSAANTIYGLAKLGVKTGCLGAVGDDDKGSWLVEELRQAGVDTSQIRVKRGVPTGSVLCLVDPQGDRSLYVLPGANNLLSLLDLDPEYVNRAELLHLSSFVHPQQLEMQLQLVKALTPAVKVSLAPGEIYAARGLGSLAPLLERTHILFLNRREISLLTGEDFIPGAQKCRERGCQVVVVTLGRGISPDIAGRSRVICYIASPGGEYQVEQAAEPVPIPMDTTGAGDAFAAGFLYGFLRGKSLEECGILGDLMARFCLAQMGARSGLPSLAALSRAFQKRCGYPLLSAPPKSPC